MPWLLIINTLTMLQRYGVLLKVPNNFAILFAYVALEHVE